METFNVSIYVKLSRSNKLALLTLISYTLMHTVLVPLERTLVCWFIVTEITGIPDLVFSMLAIYVIFKGC